MRRIFWKDTEIKGPKKNLAINSACVDLIRNKKYDSITRIYKHSNGVILGNAESPEDINKKYCNKNNYEITMRPSGGSVIITEPELTMCYSMFFDSKKFGGKFNIHEIYKNITIPLIKNLGKDFVIEGNYYIRYKNANETRPIAGHAIKSHNNIIQFDGVINLKKFDIDKLEKILHLRELWLCGNDKYLKINNEFYNLKGEKVKIPKNTAFLIRSEKEELEKVIGLSEIGLSEKKFDSALKKTIDKVFGKTVKENILIDNLTLIKHVKEQESKSFGNKKLLGHCYVDLMEEEQKL